MQEEVEKFVGEELHRFEAVALAKLAQMLQQRNLVLSGETLRSLQGEVVAGSRTGVAQLLIAFQESGRIKDMSRVNWKQQAPITVLEEYVRKVGVEKFDYVPGYKPRTIPTENVAVNRIAWGIARSLLHENEHKPSRWFAKPFYSLLNGLIDNLVTRYQQATGQVISANLNI